MLLSLPAPLSLGVIFIITCGARCALLLLTVLACISLFVGSALALWLSFKLPSRGSGTVAFFHPFAHSGGGGERVLWCAVQALQTAHPSLKVLIYCRGGYTAQSLCNKAHTDFNLSVRDDFQVIPLWRCQLIQPETYPRWTMMGQALGCMQLAYEGLLQARPEVVIDTSGWAFAYPLYRLAGVKVASYTHYPTISIDMLLRVMSMQTSFNNNAKVAGSLLRSIVKAIYYLIIAAAYGAAGGCANVVMVNSTWTREHIARLWWQASWPALVYPPCNVIKLASLPLDRKLKSLYLVSLAQFRPEKNHAKQLRAFAAARQHADAQWTHSSEAVLAARLKLIGSCRNEEDEQRVAKLKEMAGELNIAEHVDFCVNALFEDVQQILAGAVGGLHTMLDEHFGISIVEYMAAGIVPIAHNSGGPKLDILATRGEGMEVVGYLCENDGEYAAAIAQVLSMEQGERLKVAAAARRRALRFSDDNFKDAFLGAIKATLPKHPL